MIKPIIQLGDDRLFEESELIEKGSISSGKVQEVAQDVLDTLKHHRDSAAGLSAVQIGILKRIFVVKRYDLYDGENDDEYQYETLINPRIVKGSSLETIEWEGCMSISSGNLRLYGPVSRSKETEVEYMNLNGEIKRIKGEKFFSHLLLHEMDHLNGKLFLEYVDNPKNIWNEEELDNYLDEYKKFPPIV
jgi:peptide deformylase